MSCKQWWYYDDVTPCARTVYLEAYYPLLLGAGLFAVLFAKSARYIYRHKNDNQDSKSSPEETQPLLAHTDAYGSIDSQEVHNSIKDCTVKERHFDLRRITHTNDDGTPHGRTQYVYKQTDDRIRLGLEFLAVIASLALSIAVYFIPELAKHYKKWPIPYFPSWFTAPFIHVIFWSYVLFITTVRVINVNKLRVRLPSLFNHATFIYFFNLFPALINFRSALIHSHQLILSSYYIAQFAIAVLLFCLNFLSHIGDKPAELYFTAAGVKPSPENISSLFLFLSYSWIDLMVWSAYKKGLEKKDIWGLRKDDYALEILQAFEASTKAASFTVRLFGHFKWLLSVQAFYAIVELMIVFAPTLLLKKILEYVESPETNSKNLAWCFVFAMPLLKMLDSVASGCSLFIGRRVCLRMRAIIIGEVYAKALRRRITVSEVEEEEKDDSSDPKKDKKNSDDKSDSSETKKTAELGAIINLMAIDAFKVSEICGYLHFFVGSLLMIVFCIVLLYRLLGWSALVGASLILALLPLNYKLASYLAKMQKDMLSITDKRIQKLNETIQSIRIIKFFAWENRFFESIMKVREEELHFLMLRLASWAAGAFIWFITPTIITMLSFYCYTIVEGKTLTAPIAFTALSLFTLLRSPLDQLSDMTSIVLQSKVSLDRVDDFLHEEESTKYEQLSTPRGPNSPLIGFENATFSWNLKLDNDFKLRDLNIAFKTGKLNVIIGATGSGKTSLLLALLGEMELNAGRVFLPGSTPRDDLVIDPQTGLTESIAYCSQAAWLLNETIRNNIVFAAPFNQERYDKVVEACGLTRDFEILSAGDATEIGEKGITLSGGQKQRVSLARALYSNSKHLLLDDCLSAVDSHTGAWIYENCISGPLMQGRTCVLVSHNVALTIQNAEFVVVMENGRVKVQGTPEALSESGDLGDDEMVKTSVLNSRSQSTTNLKGLQDKNDDLKAKSKVIEAKLKKVHDAAANASVDNEVDQKPAPEETPTGKLVEEESKSEGQVSFEVYKVYIKALGGWGTWLFLFAIFTLAQCIYMFQTFWLREWASDTEKAVTFSTFTSISMAQSNTVYDSSQFAFAMPFIRVFRGGLLLFYTPVQQAFTNFQAMKTAGSERTTQYYIIVYGTIGLVYSIVACVRILVVFWIGIRASNQIFRDVLTRVLNAKLRFFDKTPLGRIMNRFSKDIEGVDQELVPFAEGVFACVVQCVSTLILISLITPGFIVFAIIISFLYFLVGMFYVNVSRELKRFESVTKSPIHQHFSESLNGVATIRAYGVETRFMKQNLLAIDENNRPFFYLWVANRWLSFRNDFVGSLVMLFSGIFVMISIGKIDAGLAGLSLSYAIAFSESALWIVRLYANVEMNMNSVERLHEYLEIDQEPPAEIPETAPRASWPEEGAISVKDVSLRYAPDLPQVIKNVSFEVEPCNKIGIVGRTGAGKSTIITAFFRFIDPDTGSIKIDGIDITSIGLRNLRQAITIIPQDPTLFTGTIKSNLDPFGQYSDDQIFESLRRVNLIGTDESVKGSTPTTSEGSTPPAEENQNKFLNLESTVTEGGGNLSQGQRQLMCLARSLLKSPKVILLDEATASIDYKSDALIQQTIREEFSNSTILTIAHRLRSIIDYDKILVMDAGTVVEYDDPYKLITEKLSLFYSMCENSGELDTLIKLAKEAFIAKKNDRLK